MAQSGHPQLHRTCPLLGVKRTLGRHDRMSAFDQKRTYQPVEKVALVERLLVGHFMLPAADSAGYRRAEDRSEPE
jgi:hypothetical protein